MTKIKSMIINILSTYKLIIFLLIIDTKNMQEDISSSRKKIPTFDVIEVPESELKKESLLEKGYHDR